MPRRRKPIRVVYQGGRFIATQSYMIDEDSGAVKIIDKSHQGDDVTDDIAMAVIYHGITFGVFANSGKD